MILIAWIACGGHNGTTLFVLMLSQKVYFETPWPACTVYACSLRLTHSVCEQSYGKQER